jgi:phycobilisome rod-core linker protein
VALPLLEYSYNSQNERVVGYEVAGEEKPIIYTTENTPSSAEMDEIIWAGYRQIFSEHQILSSTRQKFLESQLRNGQITVRDFIRGLLLSDPFRRLNFETNSNYRFVEICVQRVLGRDIYNEREKIAWSIVVAQKVFKDSWILCSIVKSTWIASALIRCLINGGGFCHNVLWVKLPLT